MSASSVISAKTQEEIDKLHTETIQRTPAIQSKTRERVQLYDRTLMNLLWSNRKKLFDERDKSQLSLLKTLYDGRMKGQHQGKRVVTYKLSSSTPGKLGYGRYYGGDGSLETLEQDIRATLCSELYTDLDMVNCHPTLITQYAMHHFNLDMPYLKGYVDDRQGFFKKMYDEFDLEEAVVKNAIIIILYNGAVKVNHRDSVDFVHRNQIPRDMMEMKKEMKQLCKMIIKKNEHDELYKYYLRQDNNVQGSFMALLIQTEERYCLDAMVEFLEELEFQIDVLAYDGCMIRGKNAIDDATIARTEQHIAAMTGYKLKLKIKPMIPISFEEEPHSNYDVMKKTWEQSHFYFKPSNTIVEVSKTGLMHFGITHAMEAFNGLVLTEKDETGNKMPFLKKWRNDPERRTIDMLVYKKPEDCAPNEASLFIGFAFEQFPVPTDAERILAVALFKDINLANAGDDIVVADYSEKTYADMLQNPFNKTGVCLIFSSKIHGLGKDVGLGVIERIIGLHTAHYIEDTDFWNTHDTKKEGAIMMYLEEACDSSNKAKADALKARITADKVSINPKGIRGYDVPNIARYFMTTNNTEPVKFEESDRRFLLINPSARLLHANWIEINDNLRKPSWMRAIAEHLMSIDLTGWNPRKFPVTDIKRDMMELSKSSEKRFLEQWKSDEWILGDALYKLYKEFCIQEEIAYTFTSRSFCIKILPYKMVHYIAETREHNRRYFFPVSV